MGKEILDSAVELFSQKKIDEALKQFEQCALDAACQPDAFYGMACCHSHKYDIYNAKDCFEKVIGIAPGSPEAEVARAFMEDAVKWIAGEIDFFTLSSDIRKAPPGSVCAFHEDAKESAVYVCFSCSKPVCLQCTFPVSAKYYCLSCGRANEIKERKKDSFKKQVKDVESEPAKVEPIPKIKKLTLHLGIYAVLLCGSLLYRFVLRDAAAKNAGLGIVNVHGGIVEEAVDPAMPDSKEVRFSYVMKIKVKNSGSHVVDRVRFNIKLYDTFGQKIAEKDANADRIYKKKHFLLKPAQSRTVEVKFKGLRKNVALKKVRIRSFHVQSD